jgi:copper chaperone CopZ
MEGVESFNVDLPAQKVSVQVKDGISPDAVKATVAKTGKATEFWS